MRHVFYSASHPSIYASILLLFRPAFQSSVRPPVHSTAYWFLSLCANPPSISYPSPLSHPSAHPFIHSLSTQAHNPSLHFLLSIRSSVHLFPIHLLSPIHLLTRLSIPYLLNHWIHLFISYLIHSFPIHSFIRPSILRLPCHSIHFFISSLIHSFIQSSIFRTLNHISYYPPFLSRPSVHS